MLAVASPLALSTKRIWSDEPCRIAEGRHHYRRIARHWCRVGGRIPCLRICGGRYGTLDFLIERARLPHRVRRHGSGREAECVIKEALDRFGRIDSLINNAGIFIGKPFTDYTVADLPR